MNTLNSLLFAVAIATLCGCSTPYTAKTAGRIGGYSDLQLADNRWLVTFKGNNITSYEKARDLCMLRAAELCLAAGYSHFVIEGTRDGGRSQMVMMPTTSITSATAIGNHATATTQTSGGPFQVYMPLVEFAVVGIEYETDGALEAARIAQTVRANYGISQ